MSKFGFGRFYGGVNLFAAEKSMYTEAEADKLFVEEMDIPLSKARKTVVWVYYGIGVDEDHERVSGYWYSKKPRGRYPQECWAYIY